MAHPSIVAWLDAYLVEFPGQPEDLLFPMAYSTFLNWIGRLASLLGTDFKVTTHSLRRSGASELERMGVALPEIMVFGRWASLTTCRDYRRRSQALLLSSRAAMVGPLRRARQWATLAPVVFNIRSRIGKTTLVSLERTSLDKLLAMEAKLFPKH